MPQQNGLVGRVLLEPVLTGGVLLGLLYAPDRIRSVLPENLQRYVGSKVLITTLRWLLGIGLWRRINTFFSRQFVNNFTSDTWRTGKEIVIVTGGSSGIGAAITRQIAKTSPCVIVLDLSDPTEALPANAHFLKCDVTKSADISKVAEVIRKAHGEPTVLINNAGIDTNKRILHETEEEFRKLIDVNFISHFLMVKEFLPAMIEADHGHVVAIASLASFITFEKHVDYCCAKAGVLAFHEGLAQELKSRTKGRKVRTTVVHPTFVRTPMFARGMTNVKSFEASNFILSPEDVADAVVEQLHSGMGGQLVLPSNLRWMRAVRVFPLWLQELLRNVLNSSTTALGFPMKP